MNKTEKNEKLRNWRKTIPGLISNIYNNQKQNSKRRGHSSPSYSQDELKDWLFKQLNFNELYQQWEKSNFKKDFAPSCDRIDDYKGYSLDNIKLTYWKKNSDRFGQDMMKGINTKQCLSVLQYDLDGNFIKEYYSISQAKRETKISGIAGVVSHNPSKTAGNFVWKYNGVIIENKLRLKLLPKAKKVGKYDLKGSFICSYDSIVEAAKSNSVSEETIIKNCMGRIKKPRLFIWKYLN